VLSPHVRTACPTSKQSTWNRAALCCMAARAWRWRRELSLLPPSRFVTHR
jgi:hypothetical protein